MANEFKTTFIPKRKLTESRGGKEKKSFSSGGNSFIWLIAILLFITALISSVGVYLYKMRVSSVVKERVASIKRSEKAFEPTAILNLKKLDIRLKSGTELLNNHIALSDFFDSLGESTLPDIAFDDFEFRLKDGFSVSMKGEASDYLPIAQQSDLFEKNQYIKNPIFSKFEREENTGNINFEVAFTLDPKLVHYGRKIKNNEIPGFKIQNENALIQNERGVIPEGKNIDFTNFEQQ